MTTFPLNHDQRATRLRFRPGAAAAWAVEFLVMPMVIGWLLFVALDSIPTLKPQEIRISQAADSEGAFWAEYDPYFDDYVVFYAAGDMVRSGNTDIYDVAAIHEHQSGLLGRAPDEVIKLPFFNAPPYVLPLAALSALDLGVSAAVSTTGGVTMFAVALGWLVHTAGRRDYLLGMAIAGTVVSMPFHEVLLHGQMTFLLFAGWVAVFAGSIAGRRPWLSASGLVVLAVKPQLALVPLVYLAVTRKWDALWRFALIEGITAVVAAAVLGPRIYLEWLGLITAAAGWEDVDGIWIHAMFGWNAFVRAAVGPGFTELRTALTVALEAATVAYIVLRWRHRAPTPAQTVGALVFASLLLSPHLFSQDLLLASLPVLVFLVWGEERTRIAWAAYGVIGWSLMFFHFSTLLPSPEQPGLNLVTLWIAAGLVLATTSQFASTSRAGRIPWPQPASLRQGVAA